MRMEELKVLAEAHYKGMGEGEEAAPLAMFEREDGARVVLLLAVDKEHWPDVLAGIAAQQEQEIVAAMLQTEGWRARIENEVDALVQPSKHPGREECVMIVLARRGEGTEFTTGRLVREDGEHPRIEWDEELREFESWIAQSLEAVVS